jgi:hypothetical protein
MDPLAFAAVKEQSEQAREVREALKRKRADVEATAAANKEDGSDQGPDSKRKETTTGLQVNERSKCVHDVAIPEGWSGDLAGLKNPTFTGATH